MTQTSERSLSDPAVSISEVQAAMETASIRHETALVRWLESGGIGQEPTIERFTAMALESLLNSTIQRVVQESRSDVHAHVWNATADALCVIRENALEDINALASKTTAKILTNVVPAQTVVIYATGSPHE